MRHRIFEQVSRIVEQMERKRSNAERDMYGQAGHVFRALLGHSRQHEQRARKACEEMEALTDIVLRELMVLRHSACLQIGADERSAMCVLGGRCSCTK